MSRSEDRVSPNEMDDVRAFWNRVAEDWRTQVGHEGDANRRLNSDPVLWAFLGDVSGRAVLDAGCGTGYLTNQLHERGARAVGVDLSEEMIRIAAESYPEVAFRVDSASELCTVEDASVDLVASNYVLMDTPDLTGTMAAFHRVLKPGGAAVVVFSHPCFPQGRESTGGGGGESSGDGGGRSSGSGGGESSGSGSSGSGGGGEAAPSETPADRITYAWDFPYFEIRRCADPPWRHFTSEFIWFHRPLSDYWKAFRGAGFAVEDFEEPRIAPERYHLADSAKRLLSSRTRPYSVAFKLRR
jgi:SAM-dependent methyltransferase